MNTVKMVNLAAPKTTKMLSGDLRPAKPKLSQDQQLRKQTENWVAQTFYGTLLKQMRESPFKSDMFEGGRGGQAFASMYDQQLSQRMAHGAGGKLVNAIVNKIQANKAYKGASIRSRDPYNAAHVGPRSGKPLEG